MNWVRSMRTIVTSAAVAALLGALLVQEAAGQRQQWGGQSEWSLGLLISLNDRDEVDALVLQEEGTPLPFVYIPCTGRDTILRLNVETGEIMGEYRVAPESINNSIGENARPSRTAVDKFGNLWVAGYGLGDSGEVNLGGVTKIGIVIGGTRTDADANPDPNGQYLAPPYLYNSCVDRDGDGLIKTSRGLGDVLSWLDPDGEDKDEDGGVSTAEDECITIFSRPPVRRIKTLAVDAAGDLWAGGGEYGGTNHYKIDGVTGQLVPGETILVSCGISFQGDDGSGAGDEINATGAGLVDAFGTIWTTGRDDSFETGFLTRFNPDAGEFEECISGGGQGPGVDPVTGTIWVVENLSAGAYFRFKDRDDGTDLGEVLVENAVCDAGIVVDHFQHVWAVDTQQGNLVHLAPDPQDPEGYVLVGEIDLAGEGTGVSIDSFGKVWVCMRDGDVAHRIDPVEGGFSPGGIPVGAIDMTVDLGAGAGPDAFSDMTGFVTMGATLGSNEGIWSVVWDSETPGANWGTVRWDDFLPLGTGIIVEVRAANHVALLPGQPFRRVVDDEPFSGVQGRHVEIRVTFQRSGRGPSPVLRMLEIEAVECYLAVAKEAGGADFQPGGGDGHTFRTLLGEIKTWYPVTMEQNPVFRVSLPGTETLGSKPGPAQPVGPVSPVRRVYTQVFMYNPKVFPENPEQYTHGMEVSVWPDGSVSGRRFGEGDGMACEVEVVERGPGYVKVKVPFSIEGM